MSDQRRKNQITAIIDEYEADLIDEATFIDRLKEANVSDEELETTQLVRSGELPERK
jgi:hypothetical protein